MTGGMEFKLNGFVVKVQPTLETAGGMTEIVAGAKERADELEAQVKRQGEAMAALKREVDEMRRAMAKGALETMGEVGNHGAGSAVAKTEVVPPAQPAQPAPNGEALMHLVESMIAARVKDVRDDLESQVKGLKEQLEAAKCEASDAASEAKALSKRQSVEIADVRATAAHIDARINDVELAVAEWKRYEAEDLAWELEWQEVKTTVGAVESRVAKLEKTSDEGKKVWEAMLALWAAAVPGQTRMVLSGISCLSDAALTHLASLRHLTLVDLGASSGFTAAGMRKLYSLTGLNHLIFGAIDATDAALEGIGRLTNLQILVVNNTNITDAGVARLQELSGLTALCMGGCMGGSHWGPWSGSHCMVVE
ncbi:unnamed protein product [Closterium sp. Naga37s-1]|nr:unnamed protein product [Closterium sp. Naga37s-1]